MRSPSGSAMERVEYDEHVFATLASLPDGCNRWALAGVAQTTENPNASVCGRPATDSPRS